MRSVTKLKMFSKTYVLVLFVVPISASLSLASAMA